MINCFTKFLCDVKLFSNNDYACHKFDKVTFGVKLSQIVPLNRVDF